MAVAGKRRDFLALVAGAAVSRPATGAPRGSLYDVMAFGAVADGRTLTTAALQRALDACGKAGGGVVLVPPGRYLTGALFLRNNMELHLSPGATLLASQRFDDFPAIDGRWEGIERKTYASLLTGEQLDNVTIRGEGLLDGQGAPWWEAFEKAHALRIARGLPREAPEPPESPLRYPCPRLINLIRCQRVTIEGVAMENAPSWNLHLIYCQDVSIQGVRMVGLHAQEACGVVVDSCKRVRVAGCSIAAGSDCIGVKAGYNEDGRRVGLPCEDVIISDCHLYDSFASAIAVGSETAGWIRNIVITNCVFSRCATGFHIRSARGRGGGIERVRVSNCVADDISDTTIVVREFYDSVLMESYPRGTGGKVNPEIDRAARPAVNEGTPTFRDFDFSGLSVGSTGALASIEGLPERFAHNLTFDALTATRTKKGVQCLNLRGVQISHLRADPTEGPLVSCRNVQDLQLDTLVRTGVRQQPLIELNNVAGAVIHGCPEPLQMAGEANRDVTVTSHGSR
jgi:polygalacturonase